MSPASTESRHEVGGSTLYMVAAVEPNSDPCPAHFSSPEPQPRQESGQFQPIQEKVIGPFQLSSHSHFLKTQQQACGHREARGCPKGWIDGPRESSTQPHPPRRRTPSAAELTMAMALTTGNYSPWPEQLPACLSW